MIAEDHVVPGSGGDSVSICTAQDGIPPRAAGDGVGTAVGSIVCLDQAKGDVEDAQRWAGALIRAIDSVGGTGLAVVAEDQVVAIAGSDAVPVRPTDDQVIAHPGGDRVHAALIRIRGPDIVNVAGVRVRRHVVDGAVIAEDHVVPGSGGNSVSICTAQDDVPTRAAGDGIVAAIRGGQGFDVTERHVEVCQAELGCAALVEQRGVDAPVIAKDEIGAVPGDDPVGGRPTHDYVIAAAGRDGIGIPGRSLGAGQVVDLGVRHAVVDVPQVTEEDVVAFPAIDLVRTLPAEDTIVPGLPVNRVPYPVGRLSGGDLLDDAGGLDLLQSSVGQVRLSRILVDHTMIAKDHVLAVVALDCVRTCG